MRTLILLAGKIGAGKTSLSRTLSERLGWRRLAFGDFIRDIAFQRSIEPTRVNLETLGQELIEHDIEWFCRTFLSQADSSEPLVIDGLRHLSVLRMLQLFEAESQIITVYVHVSEDERERRNKERLAADSNNRMEREAARDLPDVSDIQLANVGDLDSVMTKLENLLGDRGIRRR